MYEELIERLRYKAEVFNEFSQAELYREAADAIEELQEIVKEYKKFDLYLYVRGFRWNEKERKWHDAN